MKPDLTPPSDRLEKLYRQSLTRDTKRASAIGLTIEEYRRRRTDMVSKYTKLLHEMMDEFRAVEPTEILPGVVNLAVEESITAAREAAMMAAHEEVRRMFRKVTS